MLGYLLRRLGAALILIWVVVTATFAILHLAPGDPSNLLISPLMSEQQQARIKELYGLDQQPVGRYFSWLGAVVLRWDWGQSVATRRPTSELIAEALPSTALLAFASLLVTYAVGVGLGTVAARRPDSWADRSVMSFAMLLYSMPAFWLALVAVELLAVRLPLFPVGQLRSIGAADLSPAARALDMLHHLALPALILGLSNCAAVIRYVRNGLLEVFGQDYIRTAHAKGLSPSRVLWRHALPNAVGPLVQRLGMTLPGLLGGSVIIESIFALPGLGVLTLSSIQARDYPVVLATTTLTGVLVVLGNLAADLLHGWLDPRLRHG